MVDFDQYFINQFLSFVENDDEEKLRITNIIRFVRGRTQNVYEQLSMLDDYCEFEPIIQEEYIRVFEIEYNTVVKNDDKPAKEKIITCPLCRTVSHLPPEQKNVVGIHEKCCVCWDNECQIFLPGCGHVCLCLSCVNNM